MASTPHTIFLQNRTTRAGAQTSLSRLVTSPSITPYRPVGIFSSTGWLSNQFEQHKLPLLIHPWPSPRSIKARLGGLKNAAKQILSELHKQNITPQVIVANDHQECLLALELGKLSKAPVIAILRSSGMNQKDFVKYCVGECDRIFAVGNSLQAKVSKWINQTASLYLEGFNEEEFDNNHPPLSTSFPHHILLAGTSSPAKGFPDFLKALAEVEQTRADFPSLHCTFTCEMPSDPEFMELLSNPFRSKLNFQGRVDGLSTVSTNFDFAIHPSRRETFGMAPLELMLSGIPTLCSDTGILGSLGLPDEWLFPIEDPSSLAQRLIHWFDNWPSLASHLAEVQTAIRHQFHINNTSKSFVKALEELSIQRS
ncbi:hypothetical protein Rhal01_01662 [Rubritalea halochordaticola]|uniref:Glycosyltransferase n=1 Tax=Rubritalea halochordaticola TaxID=714537 RepID=A0ABP9V4D3_9BACT